MGSTSEAPLIRPMNLEADAAGVAAMWNASDDQWPGTYTRGVPMTAARVIEEFEKQRPLQTYLVDDGGEITGYCNLWEDDEEPGVDYVDHLNVSPGQQGKSLGRRLLQRALADSVARGCDRLDLHTWSGNLKAVPLYKKCGFRWVPDTSVHMMNYLPGILRLGSAAGFFDRADWYDLLERDLSQVPDDEMLGDLQVFTYRFAKGDERLVVTVDRDARRVCAVDTEAFAVSASVDRREPARGIGTTARWSVTNKRAEPLLVALMANAGDGISADQRASFTVDPGATVEHAAPVAIALDTDDVPTYKASPAVTTTFLLAGQLVELGVGVRHRPAVEVSTRPEHVVLAPGVPRTVEVVFRNRLAGPLEGRARAVVPSGVTVEWLDGPVLQLAEHDHAGRRLTITAEAGCHQVLLSTVIVDGARTVDVPGAEPVLVLAPDPGQVVGGVGRRAAAITNGDLVVAVQRRGAVFAISDARTGAMSSVAFPAQGPPFAPSEWWSADFDLAVSTTPGRAALATTGRSTLRPGLVVERRIEMTAAPWLVLEVAATNGTAEPVSVQWQRAVRSALPRVGVLPTATGLRSGPAFRFPGPSDPDLERPETRGEPWSATEGPHGRVHGMVWGGDLAEVQGSSHLTALVDCPPGATVGPEPLWIYDGPGTWRVVRDGWRRRTGTWPEPGALADRALGADHVALDRTVTVDDVLTTSITVEHHDSRVLDGHVALTVGDGWAASIDEVPIEGVAHARPGRHEVTLTPPPGASVARLGARWRESQLDLTQTVPVLRLGDAHPVTATAAEIAGHVVHTIANGLLEIDVVPTFGGSVTQVWLDGVGQLVTPFPEAGAIGWVSPWFGGIAPIVTEGTPFPGVAVAASYDCTPVASVDEHGIEWTGARLSTVFDTPEARGWSLDIDVLTVGSSPIVRHVLRLHNTTGATRSASVGAVTYLAPGGSGDGVVIGDDDVEMHPGAHSGPEALDWAIAHGAHGAVLVTAPGGRVDTIAFDPGQHHAYTERELVVPAGSVREVVTYVVVGRDRAGVRPWAALYDLG